MKGVKYSNEYPDVIEGYTKIRERFDLLMNPSLTAAGQGVTYRSLWQFDGRKVRIDIYRDSYDRQSFARASLFDGDKWNVVASLALPNMEILVDVRMNGVLTSAVSYVDPDLDSQTKYFEADEQKLLVEVEAILA